MANGRNPDFGARFGSKNSGGNSVSISFDSSALERGLDEIAKAAEDAVRPAAQAGAEHLYVEARLRCPVSDEAHYFYGSQSKKTGVRYYFEPGNLRNSIYQAFSKNNSGKGFATYHVAWNHVKAPYGFMVEFGTSNAPAHPFLRPAYDAVKDAALKIAYGTLVERVNRNLK